MKASSKKSSTKKQSSQSKNAGVLANAVSLNDFRSAALVVSLLINLFVLCIWITLQITSEYDSALFNFFINR